MKTVKKTCNHQCNDIQVCNNTFKMYDCGDCTHFKLECFYGGKYPPLTFCGYHKESELIITYNNPNEIEYKSVLGKWVKIRENNHTYKFMVVDGKKDVHIDENNEEGKDMLTPILPNCENSEEDGFRRFNYRYRVMIV